MGERLEKMSIDVYQLKLKTYIYICHLLEKPNIYKFLILIDRYQRIKYNLII